MMRLLAVLERDLRRMLRNPITLVSSVVMPLLYLIILGNSLQGPIKGLRSGSSGRRAHRRAGNLCRCDDLVGDLDAQAHLVSRPRSQRG